MSTGLNRRSFLGSSAAAGSAIALGDLAFFQSLPTVSAAELQRSDVVMLRPEMEPIVRLIETTPPLGIVGSDRATNSKGTELHRVIGRTPTGGSP